jgi:peptidoglycan-N-acetylglucosamine deacetylase
MERSNGPQDTRPGQGPPPGRQSPIAVMAVLAMLAVTGMIALTAPRSDTQGDPLAPPTAVAGHDPGEVDAASSAQGKAAGVALRPKTCRATGGGKAVFHGPAAKKQVALTFDDGPWPITPRFLDLLNEEHVNATFYVIGRYIPGNEVILHREIAEGHSVGNHTMTHANLASAGDAAKEEIPPTTALITKATGIAPCTFRPPFGGLSPALEKYVGSQKMELIRWDIDTRDALGAGPEAILTEVENNLHPGAIILMHDGAAHGEDTLAVLPEIIHFIRDKGYEMVTVPELLGLETNDAPGEPGLVEPIPGVPRETAPEPLKPDSAPAP